LAAVTSAITNPNKIELQSFTQKKFNNATQFSPLLQTDPERGLRSRIAALKTSWEKKEIREGTSSYFTKSYFSLVSGSNGKLIRFSSRTGWVKNHNFVRPFWWNVNMMQRKGWLRERGRSSPIMDVTLCWCW